MPTLWSELQKFTSDVISYWQGFVTGGAITGLVVLVERMTSLKLTKAGFCGLFIVTFLLSSFFAAWRQQFERAEAAESKLAVAATDKQVEMKMPPTLERYLSKQVEGPITVPPPQVQILPRITRDPIIVMDCVPKQYPESVSPDSPANIFYPLDGKLASMHGKGLIWQSGIADQCTFSNDGPESVFDVRVKLMVESAEVTKESGRSIALSPAEEKVLSILRIGPNGGKYSFYMLPDPNRVIRIRFPASASVEIANKRFDVPIKTLWKATSLLPPWWLDQNSTKSDGKDK